MIVLRKGEILKRRYIAKIKEMKIGKGTLYFTNRRICFESNKHGMCLDIDFEDLYNWGRDEKNLYVRWWEINKDGTSPFPDGRGTVKIELISKINGDKIYSIEVTLSLYYAYLFRFMDSDNEARMNGLYFNTKAEGGELLSHFYDSFSLPWSKVGRRTTPTPKYINWKNPVGHAFWLDGCIFGLTEEDRKKKCIGSFDPITGKPIRFEKDTLLYFDTKRANDIKSAKQGDGRMKGGNYYWITPPPKQENEKAMSLINDVRDLKNRSIPEALKKYTDDPIRTPQIDGTTHFSPWYGFNFHTKAHMPNAEFRAFLKNKLKYNNRLMDIMENEAKKGTIRNLDTFIEYGRKLVVPAEEKFNNNEDISDWYPEIKIDTRTNTEKVEEKLEALKPQIREVV